MTLLDELIFKEVVESSLLENLGNNALRLPAAEKIRQLTRQGLLDENRILPYLSERYQIPLLSDLAETPQNIKDDALLQQVYEETHILLILLEEQPTCLVSIHSDWFSLDRIAFQMGCSLQCCLTTDQQIQSYLQLFTHPEWNTSEVSIADQIQRILEEAIAKQCSDIHLEPGESELLVRLRIDGSLQDAIKFPIEIQTPMLSRLKILAGMDIAVRRRPQDGHYSYRSRKGNVFDLRVSSLPTESGEKIVMRLLDQTPVQYKLEALGFFGDDLEILYTACRSSNGMILVVGPTGSGKTTTLYAMLNEINSREKNILTIEDPVEYHIEGINQVAVKPEQDLTFSKALRAALRQDPDVILIGEIRDEETAEIAIKAALTGHLVLSTLHSIDAVTTIQRLVNLEIEPELLADTLKVIISQRLIRRLCPHEDDNKADCPRCRGTGYSGRVPIYEILHIDPTIKERIRSGITGQKLVESAETLYFHSFQQTAQRLIEDGITDMRELQTVIMDKRS